MTAPGYYQSHTAFSGNQKLRAREGAPIAVLNPVDADRRNVKAGDRAELVNDQGHFGAVVEISDEIAPGVVLVPGQRPSAEAVHGTVNHLCSDRYSDLGEGATYQSTFVELRI